MAARGYTTESRIENYLLKAIDPSFSSTIDNWIEAVEKFIEKETGRIFIADETATARLYDGDSTDLLIIDEAAEVTKVEVGADSYGASFIEITASGADRYFTEPANASARGLAIDRIRLNARVFPEGLQNNRITAKWGYSTAVPEDIAFATTVIVAGIINQHSQSGDQIKTERIGNFSVTYNTDNDQDSFADLKHVREILDRYRRLEI